MEPLTERDLFESTDPAKNNSEIFRSTVVAGLYDALRLLVVDVFDQRYNEPYFLPKTFLAKDKKRLQGLMKNFDYSMLLSGDRDYLWRIFKEYSVFAGSDSTRLLLDWMRNASDREANSTCWHLSGVNWGLKRKELTLHSRLPLRLERYFSIWDLLRENFQNGEVRWQELGPDWFETPFDLDFYKRQEYDYYGERENVFDPSNQASRFSDTLLAQIAWENTCQVHPPTVQEMTEISEWMAKHKNSWEITDNKMQDLFVSPLLKEDLLKRRIIAQP